MKRAANGFFKRLIVELRERKVIRSEPTAPGESEFLGRESREVQANPTDWRNDSSRRFLSIVFLGWIRPPFAPFAARQLSKPAALWFLMMSASSWLNAANIPGIPR